MSTTFGDVTGDLDDRVRVVLAGEDILVAESYEVTKSILTQPSTFSLRFGWGDVLRGLLAKAIPNTPFQLLVGDTPCFTGALDGPEASSDASSGGTLTVHGRDALAPVHDAFITTETSYQDSTYALMVTAEIARVATGLQPLIFYSNDANRKLTTGIGVKPTAEPDVDPQQASTGPTAKQLRTRIGERVYEFLKRELDRAGLFLWAAGDGSFVLSEPNGNQPASYRIVRQRGQTRNAVNVISVHYKTDSAGRYSEATVYGRGGGKKFGRTKVHGSFVDEEMTGWGFNRPLVLRDANVNNAVQAEFYARRKLAETRRAGWTLVYTVAGHTVPSLATGERAVWAPDTVVDVRDDELGLAGSYYLEKCVYRRGPQTTTELTLMRPADLVFATGESEAT
jgi:prophage tail gpP-like protein